MTRQGKKRHIWVRGRQREVIDLDLLLQVLLLSGEGRASREAVDDGRDNGRPPELEP